MSKQEPTNRIAKNAKQFAGDVFKEFKAKPGLIIIIVVVLFIILKVLF